MNTHSNNSRSASVNAIGTLNGRQIHAAQSIHVLSVGTVGCGNWVHDALAEKPISRLKIATDYRQLWGIPPQESIQAAILDDTLSSFELEAACRLIRRRWPQTKILVVSKQECLLDDALYDDRVVPTVEPRLLLRTIERLTGGWQDWMPGAVEMQHGDSRVERYRKI